MKKNRYAGLTDAQRMSVIGSQGNVIESQALHSFLGNPKHLAVFEKHLAGLRKDTEGLAMQATLLNVFVRYCNSPTRDAIRTASTFRDLLKRGFIGYVRATAQEEKRADELCTKDLSKLIRWLDTGPGAGSVKRKAYLAVQQVVKEFFKLGVSVEFTIPANPFRDDLPGNSSHAGSVIDNALYWKLLRACETEIAEIMALYEQHQKAITDPEIIRRATEQRRACFQSIETVWAALHLRYGREIPSLAPSQKSSPEGGATPNSLRDDDKTLAHNIQRKHTYEKVVRPIRPAPADVLPFVIYFVLYTVANRGPVVALKCSDVKLTKVLGNVERMAIKLELEDADRIEFNIQKPRSHSSYVRTFPLDTSKELNPWTAFEFLVRYTDPVRRLCRDSHKDNLFVFITHEKEFRPFRSSQNGYDWDSDTVWDTAYKNFSDKYDVEMVNFRDLRFTGIDIQSERFGGEILAQAAAGGQASAQVIWRAYNGASAQRARYEELGYVSSTQERFYESRGKIDPRGTPEGEYIDAATPGWGCLDAFDSPVPGERPGRRCKAYGQCPGCEPAFLPRTAYAFARAMQLRQEIMNARTYLSAIIWNSRWAKPLEKLDTVWLPAFLDAPHIVAEAEKLTLSPLGRLE